MFELDVVLRTHNRADLLGDAVQSVLAAERDGVILRLLIVDNASSDDTPAAIADLQRTYPDLVVPLHEPRPGGQHALNCGLAVATAPVVAFFDDDERVDAGWLQVIRREFSREGEAIDFIAGPCRPLWQSPPPPWLPQGFGGVLGMIDSGPVRARFGPAFEGMLTQGNCALRRSIFAEVGPYPADLPTAEDRWLFDWLMRHDRAGFYCPDLVIHHMMLESRLNKAYFRAWARREGRDRRVCERLAGRTSTLRQPWYWRSLARNSVSAVAGALRRSNDPAAFAAELNLRQAAAYVRATLAG